MRRQGWVLELDEMPLHLSSWLPSKNFGRPMASDCRGEFTWVQEHPHSECLSRMGWYLSLASTHADGPGLLAPWSWPLFSSLYLQKLRQFSLHHGFFQLPCTPVHHTHFIPVHGAEILQGWSSPGKKPAPTTAGISWSSQTLETCTAWQKSLFSVFVTTMRRRSGLHRKYAARPRKHLPRAPASKA